MSQRDDDVLKAVLAELVSDGNGPGKSMPLKYVVMRASKLGYNDMRELEAALTKGEQLGFLTPAATGGPGDLGYVTMTDAGYAHAKS